MVQFKMVLVYIASHAFLTPVYISVPQKEIERAFWCLVLGVQPKYLTNRNANTVVIRPPLKFAASYLPKLEYQGQGPQIWAECLVFQKMLKFSFDIIISWCTWILSHNTLIHNVHWCRITCTCVYVNIYI